MAGSPGMQLQPYQQWETLVISFFSTPVNGVVFKLHGSILITSNAGESWVEYPYQPGKAIAYTNLNEFWVAGLFGQVIKTNNYGQTWTDLIPREIQNLNQISFFDAQSGWMNGGKKWFKTSNQGLTWLEKTFKHNKGYVFLLF
jgi:photosystem II stability/assembly factor-like uncharacterized protein